MKFTLRCPLLLRLCNRLRLNQTEDAIIVTQYINIVLSGKLIVSQLSESVSRLLIWRHIVAVSLVLRNFSG